MHLGVGGTHSTALPLPPRGAGWECAPPQPGLPLPCGRSVHFQMKTKPCGAAPGRRGPLPVPGGAAAPAVSPSFGVVASPSRLTLVSPGSCSCTPLPADPRPPSLTLHSPARVVCAGSLRGCGVPVPSSGQGHACPVRGGVATGAGGPCALLLARGGGWVPAGLRPLTAPTPGPGAAAGSGGDLTQGPNAGRIPVRCMCMSACARARVPCAAGPASHAPELCPAPAECCFQPRPLAALGHFLLRQNSLFFLLI